MAKPEKRVRTIEEIKADNEERNRDYRREQLTPQEKRALQEAINRSRPDLLVKIPPSIKYSIRIIKDRKRAKQKLFRGEELGPSDYETVFPKESLALSIFLDKQGPKRVTAFIPGGFRTPPEEQACLLGKVLAQEQEKDEEEKTVFQVSPPTIGQIRAGQAVLIPLETVNELGYWQQPDGKTIRYKPQKETTADSPQKKLAGF